LILKTKGGEITNRCRKNWFEQVQNSHLW